MARCLRRSLIVGLFRFAKSVADDSLHVMILIWVGVGDRNAHTCLTTKHLAPQITETASAVAEVLPRDRIDEAAIRRS